LSDIEDAIRTRLNKATVTALRAAHGFEYASHIRLYL